MVDEDCVVNLKKEKDLIEQYVQLRNRYCDLLLTKPINLQDTFEWLKRDDIEAMGIARGEVLMGVAILFLNRAGEIAFFTEKQRFGFGGKLLSTIEGVAKTRGLREVWAWVLSDNVVAQKAFMKNCYRRERESTKEFRGQLREGVIFRKELSYGQRNEQKFTDRT